VNTHLHRLAVAVLLLSGLLGALPFSPGPATASGAIEVQHRDFMLGLLSAALVLSAFVPPLRLPAVAASLLSKLAFIAVAVATVLGGEPAPAQMWLETLLTMTLLGAGAVLWREARQDARWNGVLPLRAEV
jgi:hypothetical protein